MARRNPRREALLQEVRREHRAAGQKVSRYERGGVRLRKADLDPRMSWEQVQQLSTRQLHSYRARLERFVSRQTSFVAGERGEPIRREVWRSYQRAEKAYNAKVAAYEASIANVLLPASPGARQLTIAERQAQLSQNRFPKPGGHWKTLQQINRTPGGITDEDAVKEFQAQLERKLRPGYVDREMRKQRKTLEKMLTESGDRDVWEDIRKLDNDALQILLDYTNFMQNVGYRYSEKKVRDNDQSNYDPGTVFDAAGNNVRNLARWATELKTPSGTVRSAYTDTRAGLIPTQRKRFDPNDTTAGAVNLPYTDTNAGPIDLPNARRSRKRKK